MNKSPQNVNQIHDAFSELNNEIARGNIWATVLANYIFREITKESVRKRRATAYRFAGLLCDMFDFVRVEELPEGAIDVEVEGLRDEEIERRVKRNRLEKGDVLSENLVLSAKTLVPNNDEINAGSFSSEALFKGFLDPIPQERQELGSKVALRKKFSEIKREGQWGEFRERFRKMVRNIYHCDWVVGIKAHDFLDVYTMRGEDFQNLLLSYFREDPREPTEFINRLEGHALRFDVGPFFEEAQRVRVKLEGPSTSRVEKVYGKIEEIKLSALKHVGAELGHDEFEHDVSDFTSWVNKVASKEISRGSCFPASK